MNEFFRRFSSWASDVVGSSWAFLVAAAIIVTWAVTGPLFQFSDTWQLIINTGTTIVTFLMVFLIQNTQNRDAKAIHLKLDELLRAVESARTAMVDLEDCNDEELECLQRQFEQLRRRHRGELDEPAASGGPSATNEPPSSPKPEREPAAQG
jgi:low affinity Fe/Cu permease